MQLIQQSEPAPIDINKTMSMLGEGVQDNQINGVISNIVNDVCTKISTSKNDKAHHEDRNGEHNEDNDCNGKTNGDSQIKHKVSELEDPIIENSENRSSTNGKNSATAFICDKDENVDVNDKLVSESINEKNFVTSDKNTSDVIDNKNSLDNVEKQASVCNEEVPVDISGQMVENDELLMEDVTAPTTEDKKTNETENNIITNVTELNIPKSQEIQSSVTESTEKVDDVTISEPVNNNTADAQMGDSSIVSIEETPIETIEKKSEENNKEISCSEIDMELDINKPEIKKTEEKSGKEKNDIKPSIATQKFISVENITEATNSISPSDEITKNYDVATISNEQESEIHEIDQNESMDVDDADVSIILPENGNMDTTDKISIVDNDVKTTDTTKTNKIEVSKKDNDIDITEKESDDVVMEIDDTDDVTFVDKPPAVIITANVNNYENDLKQDSIINIIDNDYDDKDNESDNNEIKKDDSSEVISIEDNVKDKDPQKSKISSETEEKIIKVVERKSEAKDAEKHSKTPEKDLKQDPILNIIDNDYDDKDNESDNNEIKKDDASEVISIEDNVRDKDPQKSKISSETEEKIIKVVERKSEAKDAEKHSKIPEKDLKQDSIINIIDNDYDDKDNESDNNEIKKDDASEVISIEDNVRDKDPQKSKISSETEEKIIKVVERKSEAKDVEKHSKTPEKVVTKQLPVVCKLSNTMDILSDEEDETTIEKPIEEKKTVSEELKAEDQNKCINIDDDDDIMFIEDTNSPYFKNEDMQSEQDSTKEEAQTKEKCDNKTDLNESEGKKISPTEKIEELSLKISEEDDSVLNESSNKVKSDETKPVEPINEIKPIITQGFLKSVTKNLADMTRNELEDFCILKLVESVVDKSNLNEIKNKMKTMAQTMEELRKKAVGLAKQNRDLQVVVKTVQEDQKKRSLNPMMPMKITRSVGMQVVLTTADKAVPTKKKIATPPVGTNKQVRNLTKTQKPPANIPVPRLIPAISPTVKSPVTANATKTTKKTTPQRPEKRPHSELTRASSETVDLTDDEPPTKVNTKPIPPVRLVPSQNLMTTKTRPQLYQTNSSPRKVYIPISSTNQNKPPGAGVIRNFVPTPRVRQPSVVRMQAVRLQTPTLNRHPAPLPDVMKQYQPPAWKALPPAPDLKLSKVDNGIVISWKFEGYQPDSYEEVASFQLYAYQETPAPPSTALWKKIGDIKALPLPMACTLTQFMSGFKYYFAVRAIDVRSRIGPFSFPGSIMLVSKT